MGNRRWKEITLGDFVKLQRGHDLPDPKRRPGKVPVMGSFGLTGYHDEAKTKGPGVTVGRSGASFGVVNYCSVDFWPHNTALYVKNFHGNSERFAFYFLKNIDFSSYNSGSAQPSLNRNFIHPIPIRVPPIEVQHRIADILGTLDDKIELNRGMNVTLESMARRLFKSWFVDFDPVHAKATLRRQHPKLSNPDLSRRALPKLAPEIAELFPDEFEAYSLGPIPKGWTTRPLYDVAKFVNGAAFKSADFCDATVGKPVIKIAELKSGITTQTKYSVKDVGAEREIKKGDLIYSWSGSPDTSLATFRWAGRDGLLNQHIFNVIAENRPQKIFVYYLLTDLRNVLVEIARDKQTTGLGHVTVADMKRLQIVQPPNEILNSFERVAGSLYDLSFNTEVDSLTLEKTRDKLLPQLLSGELLVQL